MSVSLAAGVMTGSAAGVTTGRQRRWRPRGPLDLIATLGPHRRGRGDPCYRVDTGGAHWRTWRTPDGPVTLRLALDRSDAAVDVLAWGAGAGWALAAVPDLLGEHDEWPAFGLPPVLRDTRARLAGMRLSRSGLVFEALLPAVLEQLVTGAEAWRSWRQLVTRFGDPAPGPAPDGLRVCPAPGTLSEIADWHWHLAGIDGRRRRTIIAAARVAGRLDQAAAFDVEAAAARLRALPGVGPWTVAEVLQRSHGAPDLVSVGDCHLPNNVGYVLAGRARTDDAGMLDLLEPYRGHRQRVVRLIEATGLGAPRYGPRLAPRDNRRS